MAESTNFFRFCFSQYGNPMLRDCNVEAIQFAPQVHDFGIVVAGLLKSLLVRRMTMVIQVLAELIGWKILRVAQKALGTVHDVGRRFLDWLQLLE
jgi:hypothetical protein